MIKKITFNSKNKVIQIEILIKDQLGYTGRHMGAYTLYCSSNSVGIENTGGTSTVFFDDVEYCKKIWDETTERYA